MSVKVNQQKPFSLRTRLLVLAVLLMAISLGLVGSALDSAFHRSSEAGLRARMESLVYLVLAATEVGEQGSLVFDDDLGDPRLGQPGSGIYASVSGVDDHWAVVLIPRCQPAGTGSGFRRVKANLDGPVPEPVFFTLFDTASAGSFLKGGCYR